LQLTFTQGGSLCAGPIAEEQPVSFTCPDGQVIASIDFASYGTPAGLSFFSSISIPISLSSRPWLVPFPHICLTIHSQAHAVRLQLVGATLPTLFLSSLPTALARAAAHSRIFLVTLFFSFSSFFNFFIYFFVIFIFLF
jgi:hypothetical protein